MVPGPDFLRRAGWAQGSLGASVAARLAAAGCVAAGEEADELLAVAGGHGGPDLDDAVRRREAGEPLAWITGTTRFCGHQVRVDPGVYVPRPQTEALAERAAALLAGSGCRPTAVDLCTGAGAVAMHCTRAVPGAAVVGVDADPRAVACARSNGVPALVGDLGAPLRGGCAHVVTAVAPYVPTGAMVFLPADVQRYEPRAALDGGTDGLDVVRRVVADARRLLRPGGWLLLELGGDQDEVLVPTLAGQGFADVTSWYDGDGDLRGVAARHGQPT
jgi:release factor glutamine methyltransferase